MPANFENRLRQHDHSVTPPRVEVFEYLRAHDPATMSDIINYNDKIDQATIYRTIALFKKLDIAHDVILGGRKMIELTDEFDIHHHHVSCLKCGRTTTVEDPVLERRLQLLAQSQGVRPVGHQVEITGICAVCARA
jgi:Fur family transcriptional regulator, ferric uptake regulator